MQELVGRLTALDPEASETLKVVSYFDALVAAGVGLDGLLRAAATLAGAVAGAERDGRISRRDPGGGRPAEDADAPRSAERRVPHGSAWIERAGAPHANDAMIVERLALAIELIEARRSPESGLDVVIDASRPVGERDTALARLRIDPAARIRIVAMGVDAPVPEAPSTVVPTPYGILRAVLDTAERASHAAAPADLTGGVRAGLGTWVRADRAPESWDAALVALRLTGPEAAVVDAADLGVLLLLARSHDPASPPEDVRALARLDPRSAEALRALVEADSIRSAATELGMHHSTLQARHEALTRELGYDPRTATGRARYVAAALLLRLGAPPPASAG